MISLMPIRQGKNRMINLLNSYVYEKQYHVCDETIGFCFLADNTVLIYVAGLQTRTIECDNRANWWSHDKGNFTASKLSCGKYVEKKKLAWVPTTLRKKFMQENFFYCPEKTFCFSNQNLIDIGKCFVCTTKEFCCINTNKIFLLIWQNCFLSVYNPISMQNKILGWKILK